MAKVTLDTITSGYNLSKINANFVLLANALNDSVLYRVNPVGEPNSMSNDLDMNSNDILNANNINAHVLKLDGVSIVPTGTISAPADAISVTPAGAITSTDVQAALEELDALISPFGRTLTDDADAAEARDTLELGTVALTDEFTRIGALADGGQLQLVLFETTIGFRYPSYGQGGVYQRVIPSPIELIISNGSNLGTISGVTSKLVLLAVDTVAGAVELAVANAAGNHNFDETTLITTVAEGGAGGADSADVIYSAAVHTNRPFRVVGYIEVDTVGGLWLSTVTKIQAGGGEALSKIVNPQLDVALVQPLTVVEAANALTITVKATTLDFRSSTLDSGLVDRLKVPDITATISAGSTGGSIANVSSRYAVLVANDGGTPRVCWCNLAGGLQLDETNLITTTAEGGAGGADSANVIYSDVAITTPAPYKVVGFFDDVEVTPGTWANGPTLVQGAGGNAVTAMQSVGYGQTWQDLTGSRSLGVTYYNTTGKPIQLFVNVTVGSAGVCNLTINGVLVGRIVSQSGATTVDASAQPIIPPGGSYVVDGGTLRYWSELR